MEKSGFKPHRKRAGQLCPWGEKNVNIRESTVILSDLRKKVATVGRVIIHRLGTGFHLVLTAALGSRHTPNLLKKT